MAKEKNLVLTVSDFKKLHFYTVNWQLKVVKKIRSMRVNLKKLNKPELDEIYKALKNLEILSEFIEHDIIQEFFLVNCDQRKSEILFKNICALNLKNYFKLFDIDKYTEESFLGLIFLNNI